LLVLAFLPLNQTLVLGSFVSAASSDLAIRALLSMLEFYQSLS
jgi:hypothetical protein